MSSRSSYPHTSAKKSVLVPWNKHISLIFLVGELSVNRLFLAEDLILVTSFRNAQETVVL